MPKIFNLRKRYEKHFKDLCKTHDEKYINRDGYLFKVDLDLVKGIWKKGYPLTAIATFAFVVPISWFWWIRN